jgi:ornithine cyclodeaminase
METLVLSKDDMRRLVTEIGLGPLMDQMIDALERVFLDFSTDRFVAPARDGFSYTNPEIGLIEWMPTHETFGRRATIKLVGYHPANPAKHGLPTILSSVMRIDSETGHLIALLDGTFLTAIRTAAASALASRSLAQPESRVLALIGCGAQSLVQYHALSRVFPIDTVRLFDIERGAAESFEARIDRLGLGPVECIVAGSATEALRGAQIATTSTSVSPGGGPVFQDLELQPDLHVNAVGSDFPGKTEVPRSLLDRSFICADFIDQCLIEGECQQLDRDDIDSDLVEVVRRPENVAEARGRTSVYDSTGWALEDHAAADLLIGEAERLGIGSHVEIETSSRSDPQNPYAFLHDVEAPEDEDETDGAARDSATGTDSRPTVRGQRQAG